MNRKRARFYIYYFLLFAFLFVSVSGKVLAAPSVSAQKAILMDQETGRILYEKDAHTQSRIASITKIMTAILAVESGKLDQEVTVSANAAGTEGSSLYLKAGEKIKLEDLVYGLMLRSGNDGAVAIAEFVGGSLDGFVYMNESGPLVAMISLIMPRAAVPEIGRMMARGTISGGMPSASNAGRIRPTKNSSAPDSRKMVMATSIPIRKGMIDTAILIPSFPPSTNVSYVGTFLMVP